MTHSRLRRMPRLRRASPASGVSLVGLDSPTPTSAYRIRRAPARRPTRTSRPCPDTTGWPTPLWRTGLRSESRHGDGGDVRGGSSGPQSGPSPPSLPCDPRDEGVGRCGRQCSGGSLGCPSRSPFRRRAAQPDRHAAMATADVSTAACCTGLVPAAVGTEGGVPVDTTRIPDGRGFDRPQRAGTGTELIARHPSDDAIRHGTGPSHPRWEP